MNLWGKTFSEIEILKTNIDCMVNISDMWLAWPRQYCCLSTPFLCESVLTAENALLTSEECINQEGNEFLYKNIKNMTQTIQYLHISYLNWKFSDFSSSQEKTFTLVLRLHSALELCVFSVLRCWCLCSASCCSESQWRSTHLFLSPWPSNGIPETPC